MKPIETIAVKSINYLLTEMSDKTSSKPTMEGKQSIGTALHTFERVRWVQTGDEAYPIIELCFLDSCFSEPAIPKNFRKSSVSPWKWVPNLDATVTQNSLMVRVDSDKPWKVLFEHFVPDTRLPEIPFSRPSTPLPQIEVLVKSQDAIGMLGAGASKGDGPGKRPLKAVTPKSILKHYGKQVLDQQPEVKSFKKAFHKSRKEVDKIKVAPVLDQIGHLAVDVVDDVVQTILPVVEEKRFVVPELVDHLPKPQSTIGLLGSGASKGDGPPKRAKSKKRSQGSRKGSTKRKSRKGRKPRMTFKSAGKGVVKAGPRQGETWERMVSNEYMAATSIDGSTGAGVEVFNNGLLMNPHEILTPEMQIEVQRWEGFTIAPSIQFDAVPTSVLDGSLIGYYDPDPTDQLPTDAAARFQVAESHGAGKPKRMQTGGGWVPSSKRVPFLQSKFWFCDVGGSTAADQRQAYQYRFRCLVYRPAMMYNTAGTEVPVVATINFRIKYVVTFYNRTLDQTPTQVFGNAYTMSLDADPSSASTTQRIGVVGHETKYTAANLPSIAKYIIYWDGSNETLYRINDGGKMPKHVCVTLYQEGTTLTGTPTYTSLGNVTSTVSHTVTGSGPAASNMMQRLLVTDQRQSTVITLGSGGTLVQSGAITAAPAGNYRYGWYIKFANYSTITVPADMHMEVIEFDDQLSERIHQMWGPATVEYKLYPEWSKDRSMPFAQYVAKHIAERGETKEDVKVLKDKIRQLELLTDPPSSPTGSFRSIPTSEPVPESKDDAKANWVLMRNRKVSSMK